MLVYEQALRRVLATSRPPRAARVAIREALGLVLAEPVIAPLDLPPFDNSAVDGYALQSQDVPPSASGETIPGAWRVVGAAQAGRPFGGRVRRGEAVRILTGAQVPRGADTVVMQEHVSRQADRLILERLPEAGRHIRRRGEDVRRGTRILEAGAVLRPQDIGLLAALGHRDVPVFPRPSVAILVTGDEVRPPGTSLRPGQIYESNGAMLSALVQQAGARPIHLGHARDAWPPLMTKIRQGLGYDVLVISGGVSVGDKDFVRLAARRCGVRTVFWGVNIKPGMPLFFGTARKTTAGQQAVLVFGLPGNPVSVFVTFEELVNPVLYRLMGRSWQDGYATPARLAQELKVSPTRRTHFVQVRRVSQNGRLRVAPLEGQGSHQLRALTEADGWIRVVAGEGPWPGGTSLRVKLEPALV